MKSTHLILLIALIALGVCLAACEPKGPVAQVDSTAFDFGGMDQNDSVSHTFVVKNVGDQDLEILRTRSTCGCTVAKPSKKIMKPGEVSEIAVTFSSGRRKGTQSKKITVQTNDPNNEKIVLELTGSVLERLTFEPARLRMKDIEVDQPSAEKVVVTNAGSQPVTIETIKIEKPALLSAKTDALPITLQPKQSVDVMFALTLPENQKFFHGKAEFLLAGTTAPVIFYVSASQKGAVQALQKPKGLSGNKLGGDLSALGAKGSGVAKKIAKLKKKAKSGE